MLALIVKFGMTERISNRQKFNLTTGAEIVASRVQIGNYIKHLFY